MNRGGEAMHGDDLRPEYPDPDTAASSTNYPWATGNDGELLDGGAFHSSNQDSEPHAQSSDDEVGSHQGPDDLIGRASCIDSESDGDFSVSDESRSEDDYISDDADRLSGRQTAHLQDPGVSQPQSTSARFRSRQNRVKQTHKHLPSDHLEGRPYVAEGESTREIVRRGYRRPVEPEPLVLQCISEATMALASSQLEKAEDLALKALQMNPEVFQAHNLLSEIHAARGDMDKSISVAWNGAHTRPRDIRMWKRVAGLILSRDDIDKGELLKDALYCYSRVIAVDRLNIEARYERAAINWELGYKRKTIIEYEYVLKHLLPNNPIALRHLADICSKMKEFPRALGYYEPALFDMKKQMGEIGPSLSWLDVDIVAELYILSGQFDNGLYQIKRASRILLERSCENYWDDVRDDDREWDREDHPRRTSHPSFKIGMFDKNCYGEGLPLTTRVKLGILRLKSGQRHWPEAMAHFNWLHPDAIRGLSTLSCSVGLLREAANALRTHGQFEDALRFLKAILCATQPTDVQVLIDLASCYRAIGLDDEARTLYEEAIAFDPCVTEARVALWNMNRASLTKLRPQASTQATLSESTKPKSAPSATPKKRLSRQVVMESFNSDMGNAPEQTHIKSYRFREDRPEVQSLYSQWRRLLLSKNSDHAARDSWLGASHLLLQSFKDEHHSQAREMRRGDRLKGVRGLGWMMGRSRPSGAKVPALLPLEHYTQWHDIKILDWLDVFLEFSLELARSGDHRAAYQTLECALSMRCFGGNFEALLSIHICWSVCALLANDDSNLCNIARWFMTQHQFTSDTYNLFAALHHFSSSEHHWFNSSPTQKFVLRQLKVVDTSLAKGNCGDATLRSSVNQGQDTEEYGLNISLLMLYGQILYAGKSFSYAINYFLRARSLDEDNPFMNLCLSLAYLHWALKRQSENRHYLLSQGTAFLMQYCDECRRSGDNDLLQGAIFNVARMYHTLGMVELAQVYYVKCLRLGRYLSLSSSHRARSEDFAYEAGFALQSIFAANKDFDLAREVTKEWLVL